MYLSCHHVASGKLNSWNIPLASRASSEDHRNWAGCSEDGHEYGAEFYPDSRNSWKGTQGLCFWDRGDSGATVATVWGSIRSTEKEMDHCWAKSAKYGRHSFHRVCVCYCRECYNWTP